MFRRSFAVLLLIAVATAANTSAVPATAVPASAVLAAVAAGAKTLRIATAFDPNSLDPHAQALLYHTRIVSQIYESLVSRDQKFALEPQLATSWQQLSPALWRFKLRPNVVFHDNTPFAADDAIFSLLRARAPTSQREFQLRGLATVRKVDNLTIDCELSAPDAVFPDKLLLVAMMSKAWSEHHGVERPQDYNGKQETYAVRNANGTGPFMLVSYEPDVKTVLDANPKWWGRATMSGNVDRVEYSVIKADATRLAALASGQVDLVLDPPFQDVARLQQDPKVHLVQVIGMGTQYLTFDQSRDELLNSDVKGRNPFKDLRVRRAVAQAIDVDLIVTKVLRGQAGSTGSLFSPLVTGYVPELDKHLAFDPAAARAALKEAGYPDGFAVTLDCVNVTFREQVCQAAAAMLTQVGIRTQLQSSPSPLFFPKLSQANTSFVEFGWTPQADPFPSLLGLLHTYGAHGAGIFNPGRYSNPKLDQLIDAIGVEPDLAKRTAMTGDALRLIAADMPFIPLYRLKLTWAMRTGVTVVQWPNDVLELRWVHVD